MRYILSLALLLISPMLAEEGEIAANYESNIQNLSQSFAKQGNPQEDFQKLFNRTAYLVVGIIALLLITVWVLRRVNVGRNMGLNRSNHIQLIERRAISPKTVLYLVQAGDKMVVLSESQLTVTQVANFKRDTDKNLVEPDSPLQAPPEN